MGASGESGTGGARDGLAPYLVFRAGSRTCALSLSTAAETMRPLPITTAANAPAHVLGASIVRGAPTPVVDVAALLDGGEARVGAGTAGAEPQSRFVIVRVGARRVALYVDRVLGMRALREAEFHALPPLLRGAMPDAVSAMTTADAELTLVLESARLLDENAMRALGGDA